MKTLKEMAHEKAHEIGSNNIEYGVAKDAFLAGYQAANELYAAKLKEANDTLAGMADECEGLKTIIYDHDKTNLPTPAKWISVKDKNPSAKTMVLVCHKNFGIQMGYLNENSVKPCRNHWVVYVREHEEWTGNNIPKTGKYEYVNISHWMPLPELPKDEK